MPVVPADASRPVSPPPMPFFDSGAGRFEASGESLPFMEPPPPPDGPFLDDEELPESDYPWPEPIPEGGRAELRAAEVRIPEGQRPTAAMPSLPSSRPGVTTPSNGNRPLPAYAAPTIQVPSIQSGAPRSTDFDEAEALVDPEPLEAGPAPRPTMQDTRPSEERVSVDPRALEVDSSVPYISADPDDALAARDGDADTHPRIPMPRAPRREDAQPALMLDEAAPARA
ncbi:hypothetical protein, partial [Corallococcus sp. 4LFB]|uniref:hypothetical protein n=1 Tax=Corallococcus sp. 4LFB TaxID=3383249 RepID=UPI0039747F93